MAVDYTDAIHNWDASTQITASSWEDQIGTSDATGRNTPTVGTLGLHDCAELDGSNEYYDISSEISISFDNWTLAIVLSRDGTPTNDDAIIGGDFGGQLKTDFNGDWEYNGGGPSTFWGVGVTSDDVVAVIVNSNTDNDCVLFTDGTKRATDNSSYDFKLKNIGRGSFGDYFDGKIGEIIIYDVALSDTDAETLCNELSSKWGFAAGSGAPVVQNRRFNHLLIR